MSPPRLILNPRSRAVRRDLADCQELHRRIMAGFPDLRTNGDARSQLGVLYRLDIHPRSGVPALLVQSRVRPDWSGLLSDYLLETDGEPPNPDSKPIEAAYGAL